MNKERVIVFMIPLANLDFLDGRTRFTPGDSPVGEAAFLLTGFYKRP
jgi:hypothetical protein